MRRLGEILVKHGYLRQGEVDHVVEVQKGRQAYASFGSLCVGLGLIGRSELDAVMKRHGAELHLGEVLMNLDLVTQHQLTVALQEQARSRRPLGQVLVEQGAITEYDLVIGLSLRLGIPKIDPAFDIVDLNLISCVKPTFLRLHHAIPAYKEDNTATVIMANPLDPSIVDAFEQALGCQVRPAIAAASAIDEALDKLLESGAEGQPMGADHEPILSISYVQTRKLSAAGADSIKVGDDRTVKILNYLITTGIKQRASDIHIEPQPESVAVRYRIDGIVQHQTDLPRDLGASLTGRIKALSGLDVAERRLHQDGKLKAVVADDVVDLRISTYASRYGENTVIRILKHLAGLMDIATIGLSPRHQALYEEHLRRPAGVTLVTGPTGSGKTTTVYASILFVKALNRVVITVEDPVEYDIEGVIQGQITPQKGLGYVQALKGMMRQDPDVLVVGEIRDDDVAAAVMQAALTGHMALSTFHTEDATGALVRLVDMGIESFLIASTVQCILTQRLVRISCPNCKVEYVPERLGSFGIRGLDSREYKFHKGRGCKQCNDTGYRGRTAIHELLSVNDAVRDAVRAKLPSRELRAIARAEAGLITMTEDGLYKVLHGITTLEEVSRVVFQHAEGRKPETTVVELIALCLNTDAVREPAEVPPPRTPARAPTPVPKNTGEIYRTRFKCATIEHELDAILDLYVAFCAAQKERRIQQPKMPVRDFMRQLIAGVKRLQALKEAQFVEVAVVELQSGLRIRVDAVHGATGDAIRTELAAVPIPARSAA